MPSPTVIQSTTQAVHSGSSATIALTAALLAGDVVLVAADTNNGATVSSVTAAGLTFEELGSGFSMSVWWAQAGSNMSAPTMTVDYGSAYNTSSIIATLVRPPAGLALGAPFDPNMSLPAIETGNPAPSPAVFSTTDADNLILFFIGCEVGFGGTAPWEDPAITGNNTVTIAGQPGGWINGLNNTELLAPIALCLYSLSVSSTQSSVSASTSASMSGAAYLVTALVGTPGPGVPIDEACGPPTTTSLTFQWAQGPGPTPDSYTVQWRQAGTMSWTTVTGILTTSLTITGLSPGVGYEWQVAALNSSGSSGFSNSTICTTLGTGVQLSAADFYFTSTGSFVDLSQEANRRKFISASGGALYLGADGTGAFGVQPVVFLTVTGGGAANTADTFAQNNGNGGAFAETNGPLTLSVSSPPGSTVSAPTGQNVVGDYKTGQLYIFDLDQPLDNGTQRRWLRSFRATAQPSKVPRRFDCLTVDMETGDEVPQDEPPEGPLVVLRYSDDGGHTWSNEIFRNAGPPGATAQRVMFKRLGATRRAQGLDRIFELSSTDEFKVAIIGAEIDP